MTTITTERATKRCCDCKSEKSVDEFYRDGSRRDGLQGRCKGCHVAANWRSRNAHHEDYSKPLDVEWLCRDCHHGSH